MWGTSLITMTFRCCSSSSLRLRDVIRDGNCSSFMWRVGSVIEFENLNRTWWLSEFYYGTIKIDSRGKRQRKAFDSRIRITHSAVYSLAMKSTREPIESNREVVPNSLRFVNRYGTNNRKSARQSRYRFLNCVINKISGEVGWLDPEGSRSLSFSSRVLT